LTVQFGVVDAVLGVAIGAALLFSFLDPLNAMVGLWDASPMYSYGYSVPFVSAYLLWTARTRLAATPVRPSRLAAAAVLLLAIAMISAAKAAGIQVLGQLAFLVALIGVVLGLFGTAILRVSAPALIYLVLMVPVWDVFTEPLHWPFQNQSASLSMSMLRAVGVPVHREGTLLMLPGLTLEVARACSGVNYLIAVIALGIPLAYLYLESAGRRIALLAFAAAVAAFANALRVTLIGVLAYLDIGSPLHGPFHVLHGVFVAAVGYAGLFVGLRVLQSRHPAADKPGDVANIDPPAPVRGLPRLEAIALTALFVLLGSGAFAKDLREVELSGTLEGMPATLRDWEWNRLVNAPARREWAEASHQLSRQYRLANGATADIFVAYFTVQRQDRELANSKADVLHRNAQVVTLARTASPISVNAIRLTRPAAQALFWYELNGVQTSAVQTRLQTLRNAVLHGETHGAVVMVSSPSALGGAAAAEAELQDLAARAREELTALLVKTKPAGSRPRG
jgi:EpsI family protein